MTIIEPLTAFGEKLDVLIKLQAALAIKDMATQREKIVFLYSAGLKPTFIAGLLGTTPKTVSVAMSRHKKISSGHQESQDE